MDVHEYQIATPEGIAMSWDQHISTACSKREQYTSFHLWTVVGEWTLASTDCARCGNGRGTGARYDGTFPGSSYIGNCTLRTGHGSAFSDEYKTFLRKFWEAQVTGEHLDPLSREVRLIQVWQHGRWGEDGSTGHGRLRMPTNGVTKLVSNLDGSQWTLTSVNIRVFAIRSIRIDPGTSNNITSAFVGQRPSDNSRINTTQ
jgi:hypothetical protein